MNDTFSSIRPHTPHTSRAGEVALVTGAARGIGTEIARQLAAAGMITYVGARDPHAARRTADALCAEGSDARPMTLDVTRPDDVRSAAEHIEAEHGHVDALVNNAGIVVEWGIPVPDVTVEQMRDAYDVNVFGAAEMLHAFAPLLRRAPSARVVNLSSPLGSLTLLGNAGHPVAQRGLLAYSSSKAALNAVTLLFARALAPDGTRVNAANPGLVASDLNRDSPYPRGIRSAADGARVPVKLALATDGPTGCFLGDDNGDATAHVPW
ncbi:SDR family NAD(P)-dependent oxidoreductase [Paramicrobacterium fandaimingii]|uniref:SDR family NAD(P)-dependent oxidoreductase n=1 Tax=Paramicrobacterium fandaimingii TaxID=2708079 RepID=UPI001AB03B25|nr:SDR family NAD(P)-dependent oxidoreductase [Microbacterium fandaimingii]